MVKPKNIWRYASIMALICLYFSAHAQVPDGTELTIDFTGMSAFEFSDQTYTFTEGGQSYKVKFDIPSGQIFSISSSPSKTGASGPAAIFSSSTVVSFDFNNDGTFGGDDDKFSVVSMNVGANSTDPGTRTATITPDGNSSSAFSITSNSSTLNQFVLASPGSAVSGSFTAADYTAIKNLTMSVNQFSVMLDNLVITKGGAVATVPTSAIVAATVFLEGAYNGTGLNKGINSSIPLTQPYSINGHSGGSAVGIPANAVDWVLVELREAGSAAAALNSTKVGSAAGFLMNDGSIKATDGTSNLTITLSGNKGSDFFVVIYHRNHLPIMTAAAVSESSSTYTIDFTSSSANTYQTTTALASLSGSKFGMPAGDIDQDGDIDATDLSTWRTNNGITFSYGSNGAADFNLDGVINAVDRNEFHQKNTSKTRQVPGS